MGSLKKGFIVLMPVIVSLFMLTACGSGNNSSPGTTGAAASDKANAAKTQEDTAPAKVSVYVYWQEMSDDYWNNVLVAPVKKKFPNIDVEIIKPGKNGTKKLEELFTTDQAPDMVISDIGTTPAITQLGYDYDMTPMIKKYNLDLNKYDKPTLDYIKTAFGKDGKIVTLPYSINFLGLFYNKDIFDKFGVEYPKDGITFSQVLTLAKKLTRTDGGTQYIGFDHNAVHFLAGGITRDYIDPKTGKANLSTPEWRKSYELLGQLIAIPGNRFPQDKDKITRWHNEDFYKTQNVAMIGVPNLINAGLQTVPDMNWDMVAYPTFDGAPKASAAQGGRSMLINPQSKNLDAAFKVVLAALDPETQINVSKNGELPFMQTQEMKDAFCANLSYAKGKNVKAAFYNKAFYPSNPTEYDGYAVGIAYNHTLDMYKGKDINTVIRETEEEIDKKVAQMKEAK